MYNNTLRGENVDKLTIKEAAEYMGKSDSWLRKKILNGEIQAEKESFKFGQRYKISKEALDDYQEMARMKSESVDVVEVEERVSKEALITELSNTINEQNKELIREAVEDISGKIEIQEETIKQQNEAIEKLTEELQKLRQKSSRGIFEKLKQKVIGD